jgi:YVTN family beta-propeller protein
MTKGSIYPLLAATVATSALWLAARNTLDVGDGSLPPLPVPSQATADGMPAVAAPSELQRSLPPPGGSAPRSLLTHPAPPVSREPRLLAINRADNTLAVVDPDSLQVVRRVPVGDGPRGVAVSADGNLAYVADGGGSRPGNTLSVVDLGKGRVFSKVELGMLRRPSAVITGGKGVYFNARDTGSVARYNPASGKVDWLMGVGTTRDELAYSAASGRLYSAGDTLTAVSTFEDAPRVSQLPVEGSPAGVAVSPDGKQVWVSHRDRGQVTAFDCRSHQVKGQWTLPAAADQLNFTPDGKRLLASSARGHEVMLVDVAGKSPVRRVKVGAQPKGVLVTPDGKTAFVATPGANRVVRVDLDSLAVTGSVHTGAGPEGLAFALAPTS